VSRGGRRFHVSGGGGSGRDVGRRVDVDRWGLGVGAGSVRAKERER